MSRKKRKEGKKKKKKLADFPNSWAIYKKADPSQFQTYTFRELMDGLANYWELLPGVLLVARAEHLPSGSIEEHAFASVKQFKKFLKWVSLSGEPYHVHCYNPEQQFTACFNDD
jgi:hypothetical protein